MPRFLRGLLAALAGYALAAVAAYALVMLLSSNVHDRELEAAMTAVFVVGPLGAAAGFIAGARRKRGAATGTTRVTRDVAAPPSAVYRAMLDPDAVAQWKVPDGMSCRIHEFDAREGGTIRVSLTYDAPDAAGKTTGNTDTYRGRFVRLVPDKRIVEIDEFETDDPALRGSMKITVDLSDRNGGTRVHVAHEGLPPGVSPADNETGWRMALAKLAALVEAGEKPKVLER